MKYKSYFLLGCCLFLWFTNACIEADVPTRKVSYYIYNMLKHFLAMVNFVSVNTHAR